MIFFWFWKFCISWRSFKSAQNWLARQNWILATHQSCNFHFHSHSQPLCVGAIEVDWSIRCLFSQLPLWKPTWEKLPKGCRLAGCGFLRDNHSLTQVWTTSDNFWKSWHNLTNFISPVEHVYSTTRSNQVRLSANNWIFPHLPRSYFDSVHPSLKSYLSVSKVILAEGQLSALLNMDKELFSSTTLTFVLNVWRNLGLIALFLLIFSLTIGMHHHCHHAPMMTRMTLCRVCSGCQRSLACDDPDVRSNQISRKVQIIITAVITIMIICF